MFYGIIWSYIPLTAVAILSAGIFALAVYNAAAAVTAVFGQTNRTDHSSGDHGSELHLANRNQPQLLYISRDDLIVLNFMCGDRWLSTYSTETKKHIEGAFTVKTLVRCGYYHDLDDNERIVELITMFKKKRKEHAKRSRPWMIRNSSVSRSSKALGNLNVVSVSYLDEDMKMVRSNRFVQVRCTSGEEVWRHGVWYSAPIAVLQRCADVMTTNYMDENSISGKFKNQITVAAVFRESNQPKFTSLLAALEDVVLKHGLSYIDIIPVEGAHCITDLQLVSSPPMP